MASKLPVGLQWGRLTIVSERDEESWSDGTGGVKLHERFITLRCLCGVEFEKEEDGVDRRLIASCEECAKSGKPGVPLTGRPGRPVGHRGRKMNMSISLPVDVIDLVQELAYQERHNFSQVVLLALEMFLESKGIEVRDATR